MMVCLKCVVFASVSEYIVCCLRSRMCVHRREGACRAIFSSLCIYICEFKWLCYDFVLRSVSGMCVGGVFSRGQQILPCHKPRTCVLIGTRENSCCVHYPPIVCFIYVDVGVHIILTGVNS